jgi:hypothetical protein
LKGSLTPYSVETYEDRTVIRKSKAKGNERKVNREENGWERETEGSVTNLVVETTSKIFFS